MTARSFAILFAGCLLFAAGIAYHRTATVSPTAAPVATATMTLVPPLPTPLRLLIAGSPRPHWTKTPAAYILADPTPRPALPPRERTAP